MKKSKKALLFYILLLALPIILGLAGNILLIITQNWQTALAIFMVMIANNIETNPKHKTNLNRLVDLIKSENNGKSSN